MNELTIATTQADADAAAAMERHHTELSGSLSFLVEQLVGHASSRQAELAEQARLHLEDWVRTELLPHARAEEDTLYRAAAGLTEGRLLVTAMLVEHETLAGLVDRLARSEDPVRAASEARALQVLFEAHLAKENDQILPLLLGEPTISVAALLGGMHELIGEESSEPADGHTCSCGEADGDDHPELDARSIPHAIRHATIFGALEAVRPGRGLVLVAPHDPLPLLAQIEERFAHTFAVDYLERGPERWRLSFLRNPA
jgi:uncharacterized protein (DUF2249 family)